MVLADILGTDDNLGFQDNEQARQAASGLFWAAFDSLNEQPDSEKINTYLDYLYDNSISETTVQDNINNNLKPLLKLKLDETLHNPLEANIGSLVDDLITKILDIVFSSGGSDEARSGVKTALKNLVETIVRDKATQYASEKLTEIFFDMTGERILTNLDYPNGGNYGEVLLDILINTAFDYSPDQENSFTDTLITVSCDILEKTFTSELQDVVDVDEDVISEIMTGAKRVLVGHLTETPDDNYSVDQFVCNELKTAVVIFIASIMDGGRSDFENAMGAIQLSWHGDVPWIVDGVDVQIDPLCAEDELEIANDILDALIDELYGVTVANVGTRNKFKKTPDMSVSAFVGKWEERILIMIAGEFNKLGLPLSDIMERLITGYQLDTALSDLEAIIVDHFARITSPLNGSQIGSDMITVEAYVGDPFASKVIFYYDDVNNQIYEDLVGSDGWSCEWNLSDVSAGSHTLKARVYTLGNLINYDTQEITIYKVEQNPEAQMTLTSIVPTQLTLGESMEINITGKNNGGSAHWGGISVSLPEVTRAGVEASVTGYSNTLHIDYSQKTVLYMMITEKWKPIICWLRGAHPPGGAMKSTA